MVETQQSTAPPVREGPQGIRGWLVLPMLGLIFTPVLCVIQVNDVNIVSIAENWRAFTFPQQALLLVELLMGGILNLTAPALLLLFMFKRWEIFPGWYMIWAAAMPLYALLDPWLAQLTFPNAFPTLADAYDRETVRTISRSISSAVIWIPYMMRSARVANTFVN